MWKRHAWGLLVLGLLGVLPIVSRAAEPPAGVVYLTQSRDWRIFTTGWADNCPLARELARQAFLIAARDELGLTTRDAWLGAEMPSDGENSPWEFRTEPNKPVRLLHGFASSLAEVVQQDLEPCRREEHRIDYRPWTEMQERASREEYVRALQESGYTGQRHAQVADLAVPETTECLLSQMNFLAQFRALRELHEQMRRQGESPAILGALARGYANLGLLSECLWHPAHKVFKARALLYAQRMLAQAPASPLAKWHRAYTAALTSEDRWTERDLEEAEESWNALREADRPARPAWVPLIEAMCHYRMEAFQGPLGDPQLLQLANLVRYITVERAGCQTWAVQTALDVLPVIPECYRVHDGLCQFGGVALLHTATMTPIEKLGRTLYPWLQAMPEVPAEVRATLPKESSLSGLLRGLLPETQEYQLNEEFSRRRQVTDALLKTGASSNTADLGEPAWDTLGLLLREHSFLQVYRRVQFEGDYLGWRSDEWLNQATPLVEGHPYQAILETYRTDPEQAQRAVARLLEVDRGGLELTAHTIYWKALQNSEADALPLHHAMFGNVDTLTRDLVVVIRFYGLRAELEARRWVGYELRTRNFSSPMAFRVLLETDWDNIQKKLPAWERLALHYPGLATALAENYLQLGKLDEAEPMLVAALKIVPFDLAIRRQLARVYELRGQHDLWRSTLEAQLEQPDYYLDHASVQSEIAYDYMQSKRWEEAWPYAEAAAQSGSAWGLQCAAACCEGLQQLEMAEQFFRASADHYEDPAPWYCFCRRTGQGDLVAARQAVQALDAHRVQTGNGGNYDFVTYYLLEGKPELAYRELERLMAQASLANDAVWLALIADQLGDTARRDLAWDRAKELAADRSGRLGSTSNGVFSLALLIQKDLAEGGHGRIDLELAEQCLDALTEADRTCFHYALGQYLNLHGQPEAAVRYWRKCMGWPIIAARYRTLAGATLVEHGITPADYLDLLQPDPDDEEPSLPSQERRE